MYTVYSSSRNKFNKMNNLTNNQKIVLLNGKIRYPS